MISSPVRETLLSLIAEYWKSTPLKWRPERMWVREYARPNEAGDGMPEGEWPLGFWVLDQHGIQEQCVIQWRRLEAIQFGFGGYRLPRKVGDDGYALNYEIGLAAFAPLPEPEWYYFEYIAGPTWATGSTARINTEGMAQDKKVLWRS